MNSSIPEDDPKKQQRDIFYGVHHVAVEIGAAVYRGDVAKKIRVTGETDPCIITKLQIPKWLWVNSMKLHKIRKNTGRRIGESCHVMPSSAWRGGMRRMNGIQCNLEQLCAVR